MALRMSRGGICLREPLEHFHLAAFHDCGNTDSTKMCCRRNKMLVPLWGILISGMWPCGRHGATKVVIPFHPATVFHWAPFVFHLQKQNCSPFSFCENIPEAFARRISHWNGSIVMTWHSQTHTHTPHQTRIRNYDTRDNETKTPYLCPDW